MKNLLSNIVVAVSGSDASINAAKYGILLSKYYNCSLTAVYVVDTATLKQLLLTRIFIEEESNEYEESLETNGRRYLNYVEELGRKKGIPVETVIRKGAIFSEVLKLADERNVDLILLGGWERDRSYRDVISTAHREIIYQAKCSVLVVKEQDIEHLFNKM